MRFDPLDLDGQRYLACPRGESSWVKNLRAAPRYPVFKLVLLR